MISIFALINRLRLAGERRFDRTNGIDTCAWVVSPKFASMPEEVRADSCFYAPTGMTMTRRMIRRARVDPSHFTFLDIGCGKGRILLLASLAGFTQITGIEADSDLAEIAQANVRQWTVGHPSSKIDVIIGDARTAPFPDGDLFVFLSNPFTGQVFRDFVARLTALVSVERRNLIIAYFEDAGACEFERAGVFKREIVRPFRPWMRRRVSIFRGFGRAQ